MRTATATATVHAADGGCCEYGRSSNIVKRDLILSKETILILSKETCDYGRSSGHRKRFEMPIGSLPTARGLVSGLV